MGLKLVRAVQSVPPEQKLNLWQISFAGGFSALPATLLMTPIERVKVLLQTQKADPVTQKVRLCSVWSGVDYV